MSRAPVTSNSFSNLFVDFQSGAATSLPCVPRIYADIHIALPPRDARREMPWVGDREEGHRLVRLTWAGNLLRRCASRNPISRLGKMTYEVWTVSTRRIQRIGSGVMERALASE